MRPGNAKILFGLRPVKAMKFRFFVIFIHGGKGWPVIDGSDQRVNLLQFRNGFVKSKEGVGLRLLLRVGGSGDVDRFNGRIQL